MKETTSNRRDIAIAKPPPVVMDSSPSAIRVVSEFLGAAAMMIWMVKPVGDLRIVAIGYALLSGGSILCGLREGFWVDKGLALAWWLTVCLGVLGSAIGTGRNNPGAMSEVVFFVLLPLVWLIISLGLSLKVVRAMLNAIPLGTLIIAVLGWLYWADLEGYLAVPIIQQWDFGQGVGADIYGYEMRFYPITTLVFTLPFLIVSLVVRDTYSRRVNLWVSRIAIVPSLGLVFIVGRRGLLVAIVGSLVALLALTFRWRLVRSAKPLSVVFGFLVILSLVYIAKFVGFSPRLLVSSLHGSLTSGEDPRSSTGPDLLASWSNSPIWGNGLGAVLEHPANPEYPWRFELQYHLVLNSLGLMGLCLLASVTIVVFIRLLKIYNEDPRELGFILPLIAGSLGSLIANATNPYLHTPGRYWMLFLLPVTLNCLEKLRRSSIVQYKP